MIFIRTGLPRQSWIKAVTKAPVSWNAYSTRSCPDLRILFCGSDDFSVTSLRALVKARENQTLPIKSLDVVCRPAKRVGQGLKQWREVPIAQVARDLDLPLHFVDAFKGWSLPSRDDPINLIVAVSFGLLIPARIIGAAEHGGLNVHPSLLPDFRGAAPIQHALLARYKETGVSLQTLHPSKFDHGKLLLQTPAEITSDSVSEVNQELATVGADLLIEGLRSARFVEPLQTIETPSKYPSGLPVEQRTAFKIQPEDRHVKWHEWTADDILHRHSVLGSLWSDIPTGDQNGKLSRIKWSSGFELDNSQECSDKHHAGVMFYERKSLHIPTSDRKLLRVRACTPSGKPERQAHEIAQLLFQSQSWVTLA